VFLLYEGLWFNSKAKVIVASAKPNVELCSESLICHWGCISNGNRRRRLRLKLFCILILSLLVSMHTVGFNFQSVKVGVGSQARARGLEGKVEGCI
jgi:predicted nucleic acid-binding Zn ribbon protein